MLSVAFLLIISPILAQKVSFSVGAAAQFTLPNQQMRFVENQFYSSNLLSERVQERTFYQSRSRFQQDYESRPGFSVQAYANYNLSDRWSLRTGVGFSYQTFEWQEQFVGADQHLSWKDTLYHEEPIHPSIGGFHPVCSDIVRSRSAATSTYEDPVLELLRWQVPLEVHYSILPQKLKFGAGLIVQGPLSTRLHRHTTSSIHEETDLGLSCHYNEIDVHENATERINNLQVALTSVIGYQLNDLISIETGFNYQVSNTFSKINNEQIAFNPAPFRPVGVQLGIQLNLK